MHHPSEDRWHPHRLPDPFVVPVRPDPAGRTGPTYSTARGPRWRRTSEGHYVPSEVDPSVPVQRVAEAVPLLPSYGALTGWASLLLHGAAFLDGLEADGRTPRPVPLVVGPGAGRRPREGVRFLQDRVGRVVRVAGLPPPLVNQPVFDRDDGRLLGYPDLLDPEIGLAGEYDGDDHRRSRRHSRDVDREATFRGHRLEVTRATSGDLRDRPLLVARLRAAYARAREVPRDRWRWTTERPAGHVRPMTLDEQLDSLESRGVDVDTVWAPASPARAYEHRR